MLDIRHVVKRYNGVTAIDGLSLAVPEGLIFGLLGPNGAGKTTLIRMITGLISPTAGEIRLFGSPSLRERSVRRNIGYMPQQAAIYPGLSVLENILFFGRLYHVAEDDLKQRAEELLQLVELTEKCDTVVADLSGGMVRRAMLATILIHRPALLILDEPTAGVDPTLRIKFWEWFQKLAASGISILITTHHIAEAVRCDEVVFLRNGRLLEQGTPATLMEKYGTEDLEYAFVEATREKGQGNAR
jgi:ABC-2 type transport system ATP-binding protein